MRVLLSASRKDRIVVLDIGFGAPVRHVIAATSKNVAPLNIGAIPTIKLVPWLCLRAWWQDRTIGVFPHIINQTQVMTAFDQVPLRVVGQLLENFVATARNQTLIGFIGRHDPIPFFQRFCAVEVSPKRHSIFPIQILPFVQRNTKGTRMPYTNQKENRHG